MTLAAAGLLSCTGTGQSAFDPASVADASGEVTRVEPLSWWTGMQTPLQLLVNGAGIAAYDVRIEGGQGVGDRGLDFSIDLSALFDAKLPNIFALFFKFFIR